MAERATGRSSRGRNPEAAPKWAAVAPTRLLDDGPAASCLKYNKIKGKSMRTAVQTVKSIDNFFQNRGAGWKPARGSEVELLLPFRKQFIVSNV